MSTTMIKTVMATVAVLVCQSCMIGKKYKSPELDLPARIAENETDTSSFADMKWWQIYGDPTLQKLIRQTIDNNKDMLIAAWRVEELRRLQRVNTAALLPSVGADVSASHEAENYGGNNLDKSTTYNAKLRFNWELDLWGNLRWARQKGINDYLQSVEARRALRMTLVAEVATAYFEIVALDNELAIVRQTLNTRQEGVRQAKIRFEGGLTSEISYRQAQVELARTATLIPELERKIAAKENQIALLAGQYPNKVARGVMLNETIIPDSQLPTGLPSELLKRRPDVREAEYRLKGANALVGVAYTDMFPKITISGLYGLEMENNFAEFFRSPYGYVSGQLLAPLFSWGKLRAKYKAQQAAYIQETERYKKTVLTVFREANDAIVAFNKVRDALVTKMRLEQASRSYIDLARLQYINGVIGYLDVLDAQRAYFDAQIGLSNAIRDEQIAMVQLYKALGGGWYTDDHEESDLHAPTSDEPQKNKKDRRTVKNKN